ncbi:MAG: pyruvate kinase [Phycisphaeraceae bacterium]
MSPTRNTPGISTKILATVGPASGSEQTLRRLVAAGADMFRLNFSHGSLEEHGEALARIRQVAEISPRPIAVLGDLAGPKIRLGEVADEEGDCDSPLANGMRIESGEQLIFQREPIIGKEGRVSTNYDRFVDEVEEGQRVLIDDGLLRFIVADKRDDEIVCQCIAGGQLRSRKGINLPDTPLSISALSDKDRTCAAWAIEHDLDFLALSFVREAKDVQQLRDLLDKQGGEQHIIAKIETPQALVAIDDIIEASDGLMIARGDLGVEIDLARVPLIQKDLIKRCRDVAKPVIVATQMLQSMVESSSPTRAEVSDVANAIFDGTDAVMLSGETAVGRYPLLAVDTMSHVAVTTENYLLRHESHNERFISPVRIPEQDVSLAHGAWQVTRHLNARLVVVWSQSGTMARTFAKLRLPMPVVALSSSHATVRRMAMYFGIIPRYMEVPQSITQLTPRLETLLLEDELVERDETILIIAGTRLGSPGRSNAIVIHRIGQT